jgi:uncharacterized DUF497 family protein
MPDFELFLWDEENEEHLAQHGVTREEFEFVVLNTDRIVISRRSGRPMVFGLTEAGRSLCCIFDVEGDFCIPVTAYEAE